MRNSLSLAFRDEFFVNNPPWCQRKWWAYSWLWSQPLLPFSVSVSLGFTCLAHAFFPERLSDRCQGLRSTFSEICTKFDAIPLLDPSYNCIRPFTQLQIKGRKKSEHPPSSVKFCTVTPKICWYYHLWLQNATAADVQVGAQFQKLWIPLVHYNTTFLFLNVRKTKNTKKYYEIRSVPLPVWTVTTAVNVTCKYYCIVLGC
jgi:hypothetical protein